MLASAPGSDGRLSASRLVDVCLQSEELHSPGLIPEFLLQSWKNLGLITRAMFPGVSPPCRKPISTPGILIRAQPGDQDDESMDLES